MDSSPIVYWASEQTFQAFKKYPPFGSIADARVGLITGDVNRFLKRWQEVSLSKIAFDTKPGQANAEYSV